MSSYAAFLGHQPHLSIAELSASIPDFTLRKVLGPKGALTGGSKNIIVFESNELIDAAYLHMLGGTVALAKRLTDETVTLDDIPTMLATELQAVKGKLVFSLRSYGLPPGKVKELYRKCKDRLRKHGRNARYVGSPGQPAATALLRDEGILDGKHGCELVLIAEDESLWVGRTVAAQDIDAYAKRDMEKPVRDTTVGLLPPKLAQILLNIGWWLVRESLPSSERTQMTGKKRTPLTVLDPFCGTGVVAMEALLRGWTVLATDMSQKAVNGCIKNLEWLRKEEGILKKDVQATVWKQDARKPFELKEKPDVIVTETTLGPPLTRRAPLKEARQWKRENENLQIDFLKNASRTLPGVPVACIWPVWYTSKGMVRLEGVMEEAHKLGYQATLPPGVESDFSDRTTLLYRRPDQFVGREVVMLRTRR